MTGGNDGMVAAPERELLMTRRFNAPRELVWKAWTDPEHVAKWWGPLGYSVPSCDTDLRVGGKFRLKMRSPDGSIYPACGTYREIVPPERIVIEGMAEDSHPCGGGLPPRAAIIITFSERDGITLLSMLTRFESPDRLRAANDNGFSASWEMCLERLGKYVESL